MLFKKKDRNIIGISIDNDSIRAVKGQYKPSKLSIADAGFKELSRNDFQTGSVSDYLRELIASLTSAKETKKVSINFIVSGAKVCIRTVKLPVIPRQEIYHAVRSKVRKYANPD